MTHPATQILDTAATARLTPYAELVEALKTASIGSKAPLASGVGEETMMRVGGRRPFHQRLEQPV